MAQWLFRAVPPGSSSVVRVENNTGKELKPSEAVCALDTAWALGPVSRGSQVAVLLRGGEFSPFSPWWTPTDTSVWSILSICILSTNHRLLADGQEREWQLQLAVCGIWGWGACWPNPYEPKGLGSRIKQSVGRKKPREATRDYSDFIIHDVNWL